MLPRHVVMRQGLLIKKPVDREPVRGREDPKPRTAWIASRCELCQFGRRHPQRPGEWHPGPPIPAKDLGRVWIWYLRIHPCRLQRDGSSFLRGQTCGVQCLDHFLDVASSRWPQLACSQGPEQAVRKVAGKGYRRRRSVRTRHFQHSPSQPGVSDPVESPSSVMGHRWS